MFLSLGMLEGDRMRDTMYTVQLYPLGQSRILFSIRTTSPPFPLLTILALFTLVLTL